MQKEKLIQFVQEIVAEATKLSEAHCSERDLPVNYACIFCQNDDEFTSYIDVLNGVGKVIQDTATGPVYLVYPIETVAGELRILKIRKPDQKRPEKGDADFVVPNYAEFKAKYLDAQGWNLIERDDFEMLELIDPTYDVLAYYSHPTLAETLGIKL